VEVGYRYRSESEPEFRSTNSIFLALGLSFFTR